jgi:hypothetical protein
LESAAEGAQECQKPAGKLDRMVAKCKKLKDNPAFRKLVKGTFQVAQGGVAITGGVLLAPATACLSLGAAPLGGILVIKGFNNIRRAWILFQKRRFEKKRAQLPPGPVGKAIPKLTATEMNTLIDAVKFVHETKSDKLSDKILMGLCQFRQEVKDWLASAAVEQVASFINSAVGSVKLGIAIGSQPILIPMLMGPTRALTKVCVRGLKKVATKVDSRQQKKSKPEGTRR